MKNPDKLAGIEISSEKEDLVCYSFDSSETKGLLPSAVAWPKKTDEVIRLVQYANENGFYLIPRGAGTGTTGASVPIRGESIVLSFEKMKRLLEFDTANLTVVVEPGIINSKLQRESEHLGFFYPPDPASFDICTIGGNIATNAGGPRAVKYGVTRNYVMEIEAVLPDGSLVRAGSRTYKSAVGYDLKDIFIGSEGTLAIFTKIRLKLLPLPPDILTLLVSFKSLESCGAAVSRIIASRIIPRAIELMDRTAIYAVEKHKPTGLPTDTDALLIIELDGCPSAIRNEAETVMDIVTSLSGDVSVAKDPISRAKLWESRRSISTALYLIKPSKISEDIVVPRSKISSILRELRDLSDKSGIQIVSFGHAGDGNIHVNIMADNKNDEEYKTALSLVGKVFEAAIRFGGSISGEHGIGVSKAPYIGMEINKRELELMRGIKKLYDPKGMLNPGKVLL